MEPGGEDRRIYPRIGANLVHGWKLRPARPSRSRKVSAEFDSLLLPPANNPTIRESIYPSLSAARPASPRPLSIACRLERLRRQRKTPSLKATQSDRRMIGPNSCLTLSRKRGVFFDAPGVVSAVTEAPFPLAPVEQSHVNHPGSYPRRPNTPCRPGSNGRYYSLAVSGTARQCSKRGSKARRTH
jgi:hypothetical protein